MSDAVTDAEAIARIIEPEAFECLKNGKAIPSRNQFDRIKASRDKAHAILSYLASRREAEPVRAALNGGREKGK